MPRPYDNPRLFDCSVDEPEHLIDGYVPGDLWPEPPHNPTSIDARYSAGRQSITVLPSASFPAPSSFLDTGAPFFDSLSPASDALYSSSSSPLTSAPPTLALYECTSQQNSPSLYTTGYEPPAAAFQGFDFSSTDNFSLGAPEPCVVASPVLAEGNLTDLDLAAYGGESMYDTNEALENASPVGMSQHKRARTLPTPDAERSCGVPLETDALPMKPNPVRESSNSGSAKGKKVLRSASRSSKNVNHKPNETAEERRSRNAHNMVEKKYRSRLNAQFEGLLGVLPNELRSPGAGDEGEVRITKGDVLDLSMTYIRTLEKQRTQLEREHDELNASIDRLHTMLVSESRPSNEGFGSDGA